MKAFIKSLFGGFDNIKPLIIFELLSWKKSFYNYAFQPMALLLLSAFVIAVNWPYSYSSYGGSSENAGEAFFIYIMMILIITTTVATAFSAAISITTEKEKKTLTLLRMTGLSGMEIILGKAMTTTIYTLVLIMPQVPLLYACPFIGGVSFIKVCMGIFILGVMTYFYSISAVGISMLFKRNYAAVSAVICYVLFINFGLVFLDYFILNIPTYRNEGCFKYFMPLFIWENFFRGAADARGDDFIFDTFGLKIQNYIIIVGCYILFSWFLTKIIAKNFEKYLKWREE